MDLRVALKEQYHAALAMLGQCVERCPDDLWTSGDPPRSTWRIAYHAAFYTHLYLGQSEAAFAQWPSTRPELHADLWDDPDPGKAHYTRSEVSEYIRYVEALVDPTVDTIDLDTSDSGFDWYPNISKLSHQLMNLRHLQGHVGQLSELLMQRGVDLDWVSRASGPK